MPLKGQVTEIFGGETQHRFLARIVGNIFQSFGLNDIYTTLKEKAASLLYLMVKNHFLADFNKRSGDYAFNQL